MHRSKQNSVLNIPHSTFHLDPMSRRRDTNNTVLPFHYVKHNATIFSFLLKISKIYEYDNYLA